MHSRQIDFERPPMGTYLNSGAAARNGLRINRFCYDLREPARREAFRADEASAMAAYGLDEAETALIRERDWLGLVRRGANMFVLVRLTHLCGVSLPAAGAQMRGESLERYLAGRGATSKEGR